MIALVVQPEYTVGPGLIKDELEQAGWQLDIRLMEQPGSFLPGSLTGYDALVILGGSMNVYEEAAYPYLIQVDRLIREAVRKEYPVLGACLGGQLIAKALNAPVTPNTFQEIGWYNMHLTQAGCNSPFFKGLPGYFPVFHWHSDTFALPDDAAHLAATRDCSNQAFSFGQRILAVQFHLEITPEIINNWNRAWSDDIESLRGPGSVKKLEADTSTIWDEYKPLAIRILKNWADLASGCF